MLNKSFSVIVSKQIKNYKKNIKVDSDKSISIRSFLIGSISHNISKVKNPLDSDDVLAVKNCLKKLNVKIKKILLIITVFMERVLGLFIVKKEPF